MCGSVFRGSSGVVAMILVGHSLHVTTVREHVGLGTLSRGWLLQSFRVTGYAGRASPHYQLMIVKRIDCFLNLCG